MKNLYGEICKHFFKNIKISKVDHLPIICWMMKMFKEGTINCCVVARDAEGKDFRRRCNVVFRQGFYRAKND